MRTRLLTIVFANAVLSFAYADTIVIRDAKKGTKIAEVDIDAADAKFIHAGRTLRIERKAPVMELRARKLILPRVGFRDASLDDIATHLRLPNSMREEEPGGTRPVINFVVIDQAKRKLLIDIQLEEVSLHDLLASLAKKYGLIVTYDDYAIIVTDPKQSK